MNYTDSYRRLIPNSASEYQVGYYSLLHCNSALKTRIKFWFPVRHTGNLLFVSMNNSRFPYALSLYTVGISSTTFSALLKYDSSIPLFPADETGPIFAFTKRTEIQLQISENKTKFKTDYHEN